MRKISILVLLASLLVGGVVSAQDTMPVVCGNLAEADCNILQQAKTATAGLSSGDFTLALTFSAENMPDMPSSEPMTFSLTGTGAFAGDMSVMGTQPTAEMMKDPAAMAAHFQSMLGGFDAELNLTLSLPPQLLAMMGSSSPKIPSSIPLNVKLVDGKAYLDFASLNTALGPMAKSAKLPTGWTGIDVAGLMSQMLPQMMSMSGYSTMNQDTMSEFSDPSFINKFVTIEREADDTVDGQAVAVFKSTVDLSALMSDPAMRDMMMQASEAQGNSVTGSEMAQVSQMMNGLTFSMTQQIGLTNFYVYGVSADFAFDMTEIMKLQAGGMGATATEEATAPAGPAPVVRMSFQYALSNPNGGQTIATPENATLIPLESLMGGMMGGIDSSGTDTMMEGVDTMMTPEATG